MLKLFKDIELNKDFNYIASFIEEDTFKFDYNGFENEKLQFDIASLTKLFTTTRILQLIEEEHLNLNTYASDIISLSDQTITIQDLLFHETGMLPSVSIRHTHNKNDIIQSILNCDDQTEEKNYEYSCINFIILGFIIEKIDKMTLDQSFFKYIFKPLNMKNTSFNPLNKSQCIPTEIDSKRGIIQGEVHDITAFKLGGIAGNAGLFSTVKDLSLFTQDLIRSQSKLLNENTKLLLKNTFTKNRYLGWNKLSYQNKHYHTGFTGPMLLVDFEHKKGFVFLNNAIYPYRNQTNYKEFREKILINFIKYY